MPTVKPKDIKELTQFIRKVLLRPYMRNGVKCEPLSEEWLGDKVTELSRIRYPTTDMSGYFSNGDVLAKTINGVTKAFLLDHNTLTMENRASLTKRIVGQIKGTTLLNYKGIHIEND